MALFDRSNRWFLWMCTGRVAQSMIFPAYSAVLPFVSVDWKMSSAQAGSVQSAWHAGYLVSLFIAGFLADRFGAKKTVVRMSGFAAAAAMMFAVFSHSNISAVLLYGLAGLLSGGSYTPGLKLIFQRTGPASSGAAMGLFLAAGSIGYAVALMVSSIVVPLAGWRMALILCAGGTAIASLVLLLRRREKFDQDILRLIVWSILFTIVSELAFTFYISVYGLSNLIGHYFKILSFYLIYRAIIVTGLENPYRLLFYDLRKNREELQTIIDSSPIMIFYKDCNNKFIHVNRALAEATGQAREEIEGRTAFEVYPNQATDYLEDDMDVIASGKPKTGIIESIDTKVGTRWVQTDKIPYRDMNGRIIGIIGFSIDITNQKQAEEALRESEVKQRLFIESLPVGLYRNTPGPQGRFIMANTALARLHGFDSVEEFLSQNIQDLYVDSAQRKEISEELVEKGFVSEKEIMLKRKDGASICGSITARAIRDHEGNVVYFDGTVTDITDRKRMEEKILTLSITDQLTGLYNRRGFLTLAEQQLKLSDRNKNGMLLFFADLDLLKQINDTLGHEEGDKALIEAANILKETFRTSDIISRLGGDEFAALAIDIKVTTPEVFTARLHQLIDIWNNQENRKYKLSISMGCAYYDPEKPCSIDDLISRADKLMYEQKQNKKNHTQQSTSLSSGNS